VQVHYDEGIANRIGPEPCVVGREAEGEASAGVRIGQPLNRERINWDADAVVTAEGETGCSSARAPQRRDGPAVYRRGNSVPKRSGCAHATSEATLKLNKALSQAPGHAFAHFMLACVQERKLDRAPSPSPRTP